MTTQNRQKKKSFRSISSSIDISITSAIFPWLDPIAIIFIIHGLFELFLATFSGDIFSDYRKAVLSKFRVNIVSVSTFG